MPYSPDDIANLPKNVQEMDEKSRRQWCDIFNSAYEKHGSDEIAFKYANGVLKKEGEQPNTSEKGLVIEIADCIDPNNIKGITDIISKEIGLPIMIKGMKEFPQSIEDLVDDDALSNWLAAEK